MSARGDDDARWMRAAIALSQRGRGRTTPNPNVGCVIVRDGVAVGRGWTRPGGRPHAEAMALAQAAEESEGATVYVTLEPCAHASPRGPACADLLVAARPARVVAALTDPDPRTAGQGFARLRAAGIDVIEGVGVADARRAMAGFLTRQALGRPHVTLKLATSLDGKIALPSGESRWITGPAARAHGHLERARADAILVGRNTVEADAPTLDVRLPGLEGRSPRRLVLSAGRAAQRRPGEGRDPSPAMPHAGQAQEMDGLRRGNDGKHEDYEGNNDRRTTNDDWTILADVAAIATLPLVDHLLVEGGAATAAAFLTADMVDRLLLYRAPILIGEGRAGIGVIGLSDLAAAHGRWALADSRMLGTDRLEIFERQR